MGYAVIQFRIFFLEQFKKNLQATYRDVWWNCVTGHRFAKFSNLPGMPSYCLGLLNDRPDSSSGVDMCRLCLQVWAPFRSEGFWIENDTPFQKKKEK